MKKIVAFLVLITTSIFAGLFGGGSDLSGLLTVVTKISTITNEINSNELHQLTNQIKQIENEYKMIENQYKNLQKLSESVKDGNLSKLVRMIDEINHIKENSLSIIYDQQKISNEYWDIYKKNPSEFLKSGVTGNDIQDIYNTTKKAEEQMQYALYDSMTSAGFTATIDNDAENIQNLVNAVNTSEGNLEALQGIANLIGNTNSILLKIGSAIETNSKVTASVEAYANTEKQSDEAMIQALKKELDGDIEADAKEIGDKYDKPFKIGF